YCRFCNKHTIHKETR
ncbi:50S ribosomal protein L33, partial [bacterium]|nr:50S ribosomal protein L33 [bacterium]